MDETVHDVQMVFIENTAENNYTIECMGSHHQDIKLKFDGAEGIEMSSKSGFEAKNAFLQMAEGEAKVWNLRFCYPVKLRIQFMGKIMIEVE
jgi:hypothetical protein